MGFIEFSKVENKEYEIKDTNDGGITAEEVVEPARPQWGSQLEFVLSAIGYSIGLGNIFRFPYLCYEHGGGAFLIPYFIALVFLGIPLVYLEVSWGQLCGKSSVIAWNLSPILRGASFTSIALTIIVVIYYNIIMCIALYYFAASFTSELPWSHCNNKWGLNCSNISQNTSFGKEYLFREVLHVSDSIYDIGYPQWHLVICLLIIWIITLGCILRGIRSSGKVVYFTALFPYVCIIVLLVRGLTLPGSINGIKKFIIPDFTKLLKFKVWSDAFTQLFYSLGPGWGALITFGSYNKPNHNSERDAILIPIICGATSVLGGFTVFSLMGFLSHKRGVVMEDVLTKGPTVAFEAYSEALAQMPFQQPVFSALFFFMLIILGLDSEFGMIENLTTCICDWKPRLFRNNVMQFNSCFCAMFFCLGIFFTTNAGMYMIYLVDTYAAVLGLLLVTFLECITVCYIYGYKNYHKKLTLSLNRSPLPIWKYLWMFVTPFLILFTFASLMFASGSQMEFNGYIYGSEVTLFGMLLALVVLLPIPIYAIFCIFSAPNARRSFKSKILHASEPMLEWSENSSIDKQPYI